MKQQVQKYTIVCRGDTEAEVQESFDEAVRRIKEGNVSGADRREDAGFYFNVTDDVAPGDVPA